MPLVTFVLGFKTGELRSLDLPIEVRKHDSTIVARTLASQAVDVRPGHYYASARLPGGQRLLQPFELGDEPQTITLVPDPEDESAHEWEETAHYLQTPRAAGSERAAGVSAGTKGLGRLEFGVTPAASVKARFRLFAGNPVTGDIRLEPAGSHLTLGAFERGRIVQFVVHGSTVPLIAQLVEPGGAVHDMAIPAGPSTDAQLVFTRREDATCRMDVHLRNNTADLLLRHCDTATLADAGESGRSKMLDAEQLLADKGSDPIAAAAAACAILKYGQLTWLHDWTANLDARFPWLPDGAAIRGEHLARSGKHQEAAARLFEVVERGLPIIGDALFFTAERLKWYASLKPDLADGIDLHRAGAASAKLQPFAAMAHRQRPLTSYSGLDPARPDTGPGPTTVPAESIDLAEWLGEGTRVVAGRA